MTNRSVMTDASFTARQVELVRLLARQLTYREIGAELGVSERTIKSYADVLRSKLGVQSAREIPEAFMRVTGENPYPRAAA